MRRFAGVASSLFACLTACGHDDKFTDAAPPPDGRAVDGNAGFDAGIGDVTVTTHVRCCDQAPGTPAPGIEVVVLQPDGTTGDHGVTDGNGDLTLRDVRDGASVSAVYPTAGGGGTLATVVGVAPGDHLDVGGGYFAPPVAGADGTMTVSFPTYPSAAHYVAYHPCTSDVVDDGAATSLTLHEYAACQTPTADLVLFAYDASYVELASGRVANTPYTAGASATLTAWTATVPNHFTTSASALDPAVTLAWLAGFAVYDHYGTFGTYYSLTPTDGAASTPFTIPPSGDRVFAYVEARQDVGVGPQWSMAGLPGDSTTATFVGSALPWVGQVTADATGGTVSWVETSVPPGTHDGAVAMMSWSRVNPSTGSTDSYAWNVVLPPDTRSFAWPAVPTELAGYTPVAGDPLWANVELIDLSSAADYHALRQVPEWELTCVTCAVRAGDQPSADVAWDPSGGEGFTSRSAPRRARPSGRLPR